MTNEKRLQAQVEALTDRCLTLEAQRDREHARWHDVASRYNDLRETAMAAAHDSGGPGFVLLGLDELQREMAEWELKNFGGQPPHRMFLGMVEENGELAHALLKAEQNIRGSAEEHEAKAKDAVGDLLVFCFNFCSSKGWSLERILLDTWAEVSQRDWTKDPNEGNAASTERVHLVITTEREGRDGDKLYVRPFAHLEGMQIWGWEAAPDIAKEIFNTAPFKRWLELEVATRMPIVNDIDHVDAYG